jgi:hypothetical protein
VATVQADAAMQCTMSETSCTRAAELDMFGLTFFVLAWGALNVYFVVAAVVMKVMPWLKMRVDIRAALSNTHIVTAMMKAPAKKREVRRKEKKHMLGAVRLRQAIDRQKHGGAGNEIDTAKTVAKRKIKV